MHRPVDSPNISPSANARGNNGTGEGEGGAAAADGGRQNTSLINACTVECYPHVNTVQDIRPLLVTIVLSGEGNKCGAVSLCHFKTTKAMCS